MVNLLPHCHRGERQREEGCKEARRKVEVEEGEDDVFSLRLMDEFANYVLFPLRKSHSLFAHTNTQTHMHQQKCSS